MPELTNLVQSSNPDWGIYIWTEYAFEKFHNAYHLIVPERLHNLPSEVALAGFAGAYAVTRSLQWASRNVVDRYIWPRMPGFVKDRIPSFDNDLLPKLERLCEYGIPAAFLIYGMIDQAGLTEALERKPMDNWGLVWAQIGGVIAAEQDLRRRK